MSNPFMMQLLENLEKYKGLNNKEGSSAFFMSIYWLLNHKHQYLHVFIRYEDQYQCV